MEPGNGFRSGFLPKMSRNFNKITGSGVKKKGKLRLKIGGEEKRWGKFGSESQGKIKKRRRLLPVWLKAARQSYIAFISFTVFPNIST